MSRKAVFHDTGVFDDGGSPITFGAVDSISKSGDTQLTGDVTFSEGSNVTLTQTGNDIAIASSGGGGGGKLYDYEVTGSDKTSIDTNVDGSTVANFAGHDILEVFIYVRTDEAAVWSALDIVLNNDTSAVYDRVYTQAYDSTTAVGNALAQTSWAFTVAGASAASAVFSAAQIAIPNYLGTVGNKSGTMLTGVAEQSTNITNLFYQLGYRSTSAISRLMITPDTAGKKLKVGTRLLVYGR